MTKKSILDYFPHGLAPRPEQADILLQIEKHWRTHDAFAIVGPTALGKTFIAGCIANWAEAQRQRTRVCTPTNILRQQFMDDCPEFTTMLAKASYGSDKALRQARSEFLQASKTITTAALYKAYCRIPLFKPKIFPHVLIFDEAHTLLGLLESDCTVTIDKAKHNLPDGLNTVGDVISWLKSKPAALAYGTDLNKLYRTLCDNRDLCVLEDGIEDRKGNDVEVLRVKPNTRKAVGEFMWPASKVRKVILMSATINDLDVEALAFPARRVCYLHAKHPIPAENRPVFLVGDIAMSYGSEKRSIPILAERIKQLMTKYPDKKGAVHLPYRHALLLQEHLQDARVIYHGKGRDKAKRLDEFLNSDSKHGKVIIASGAYEGLDWYSDRCYWQIVGKIPNGWLGSASARENAHQNSERYTWAALKLLIQASGRVCRTPTDYGETWIFDSAVNRLLAADQLRDRPLIPGWFRETIQYRKGI